MVPTCGKASQGKKATRGGIIQGDLRLSKENNPGWGAWGFVPDAVRPS